MLEKVKKSFILFIIINIFLLLIFAIFYILEMKEFASIENMIKIFSITFVIYLASLIIIFLTNNGK